MSAGFRILDSNFIFEADASLTASSSDPSFPVSNIPHFFRSKVWRSSGTFVISSSNNKIDFAESVAGPQLTATITTGTYTIATLETEIKTQLEAVGANTYTVTNSGANGKWTISSSGVALELRWNSGTNTANSIGAALGFDVTSDDTGFAAYTGANPAIHTEESITIDLVTIEGVDSFAIIFDPRFGNKFTQDAEIRLQANATNTWSSPAVDVLLTVDNDLHVINHFFSAVQSYRYWRIKMVDPTNDNLYVELGKLFLSKATQLDHGPEIGFKYSIDDQSKVTKNEYGHEFVDVYPNKAGFDFNLAVMPFSDIETLANIYNRVGNTTPICVSLDPFEECFDKERLFIYGKFKGVLKVDHRFHTYFNTVLSIEEAM